MGLMFDMVFNHTSMEHEWLRRVLAGEKKYQDGCILRDGKHAAHQLGIQVRRIGDHPAAAARDSHWLLRPYESIAYQKKTCS